MAEVGIDRLDGKGLALVRQHEMRTRVEQFFVNQGGIGVIPARGLRVIQQILERLIAALKRDSPIDDATRGTIHVRHDVDWLFLVLMNVNNSSISSVSTPAGSGAGGNR